MRQRGITALLLGFVTAATSCNSNTVLVLSISNIPNNTESINIATSIDGKTYNTDPISTLTLKAQSTLSSITIPFEFTDKQIGLSVSTKSNIGNKCPTAKWDGTAATIEPGTYSIPVPLQNITDDNIRNDLFTSAAISSNNTYMAGASSTLIKWDGCYWTQSPKARPDAIVKLYSHPKVGLWGVGTSGVISKYVPLNDTWTNIDASSVLKGTGEVPSSITWTGITYIDGTPGDLLVVGVARSMFSIPGGSQCFTIRLTQNGTGYTPSRLNSAYCGSAAQTCTQYGTSNTASCYFQAQNVFSFPPDRIALSGVANFVASTTNQTAFAILDSQLQLAAPTTTPQYVVAASGTDQPYGSSGIIWGVNLNDFWLASNHLFHITNAKNDITAITNKPTFYETDLYKSNPVATQNYRLISIWGTAANDFWVLAFPTATRFTTVHHFQDRESLKLTDSNIGKVDYSAGIDNYVITSITGTADNDVWFSAYNGIRIHYDKNAFRVYR